MGIDLPAATRCPECTLGQVRPVARAGRIVPYRGVGVELPEEFAIPTCDHCGAESMTDELAGHFDLAIETAYWSQRPARRARGDVTPTTPIRLPRR